MADPWTRRCHGHARPGGYHPLGKSNGIDRPDHLCLQFRSASQHEVRLPQESPDDTQAKETRLDPNTDDDARDRRLLKHSRKGPIQKSWPECIRDSFRPGL